MSALEKPSGSSFFTRASEREGGREGGKEGERQGGREGGREGRRERGRERGREGGRKELVGRREEEMREKQATCISVYVDEV